jgi:uncharacterized metal-binding protein YceD (DUF177 family)
MTEPVEPPPEFSRTLPMSAVGPEGRSHSLRATPEECAALAARFGIPAVESLKAELQLKEESSGAIRVRGQLRAKVVQLCVVTLEPFKQVVEDRLDLRFLPARAELSDDPEGPDEIETEYGTMQLGEAVAEQLSLALDPYPRAPGAELPPMEDADEAAEEAPVRPNPFASLARLKKN